MTCTKRYNAAHFIRWNSPFQKLLDVKLSLRSVTLITVWYDILFFYNVTLLWAWLFELSVRTNHIPNQKKYQIKKYQNGQLAPNQRTCLKKVYVQLYIYRSTFKQDTTSKFTFSTQQIQVQHVEMIDLGRCRSKNLGHIYT